MPSMRWSTKNVDSHFSTKIIKKHCGDKPWFNGRIRILILRRQTAFVKGDKVTLCSLRNQVAHEIISVKKSYYAGRVRVLQKTDPAGWHRNVRNLANMKNSELTIHVEGIDPSNNESIADEINNHLSSFSQTQGPIRLRDLPAYLPAQYNIPEFNLGKLIMNLGRSL